MVATKKLYDKNEWYLFPLVCAENCRAEGQKIAERFLQGYENEIQTSML